MSREISYSEVAAADVVGFFVKGYKLPDGTQVERHDWFYDAAKQTFVIKLQLVQGEPTVRELASI